MKLIKETIKANEDSLFLVDELGSNPLYQIIEESATNITTKNKINKLYNQPTKDHMIY